MTTKMLARLFAGVSGAVAVCNYVPIEELKKRNLYQQAVRHAENNPGDSLGYTGGSMMMDPSECINGECRNPYDVMDLSPIDTWCQCHTAYFGAKCNWSVLWIAIPLTSVLIFCCSMCFILPRKLRGPKKNLAARTPFTAEIMPPIPANELGGWSGTSSPTGFAGPGAPPAPTLYEVKAELKPKTASPGKGKGWNGSPGKGKGIPAMPKANSPNNNLRARASVGNV